MQLVALTALSLERQPPAQSAGLLRPAPQHRPLVCAVCVSDQSGGGGPGTPAGERCPCRGGAVSSKRERLLGLWWFSPRGC